MSQFQPFRVLVVCTGNVCRSPLVERVLQARLDEAAPGAFEIRSAGTNALAGHGMTAEIAAIAGDLGGSDAGFISRQLTGQVLAGQDLVLALTREHRAKVLEIAPRLLRRTFTLREFGRMVRFVTAQSAKSEWAGRPYDRWQQLLPAAASVRHQILADQDEDDVVDPFRRDEAVHQEMVSQIAPALESLVRFESAAR